MARAIIARLTQWRLARALRSRIHRPGPGLPPLPEPPRGDDACRATLEQLLGGIVATWAPRVDRVHGGYHLNHNGRGKSRGPGPRRLITQARTLWFWSTLAMSPYGRPEHLDFARQGFAYLRDVLHDPVGGGYWWEVDPSGRVTNAQKHLCGQAFALYALSAYARASGEAEPGEMARDQFDRVDRCRDLERGGYAEDFDHGWAPLPDGVVNAMGVRAGMRTLNTHLHLLEAFSEYARFTADDPVHERMRDLSGILTSHFWRGPGLGCIDDLTPGWEPIPGKRGLRVSYGHDVETAWLLLESAAITGDGDAALPAAVTMTKDALARGFDQARGGLYTSGPLGGAADDDLRVWWVQAEALNATLELSIRAGDPHLRDVFERLLCWISEHQVDRRDGGWHDMVLTDGRGWGPKAGVWKCPYHEGRAVLRCLALLAGASASGQVGDHAV